MAQTTNQMNFRECEIEVGTDTGYSSIDAGTWVAIAITGGDRMVGEEWTFEGDTPVLKGGKRSSLVVVVRYIYTEESGDPFEVVRAIHETAGGGTVYLRWSPKGGDSGEFQFTTDEDHSILTAFSYPQGEAKSPDITLCEFAVTTASITKSAHA